MFTIADVRQFCVVELFADSTTSVFVLMHIILYCLVYCLGCDIDVLWSKKCMQIECIFLMVVIFTAQCTLV